MLLHSNMKKKGYSICYFGHILIGHVKQDRKSKLCEIIQTDDDAAKSHQTRTYLIFNNMMTLM